MVEINWSAVKNDRLKKIRGVSFEELICRAELRAIRKHPQRENQLIMLFDYRSYIWAVPFTKDGDQIFLKTLFPSRKYTKQFKKGTL